MGLQTYTQAQYVSNWMANFCASLEITQNYVPGDIELAIAEADAGQATVLQLQCGQVIAFARATTSTGADLDSFYAQFDFFREPAIYASGIATFTAPIANPQNALIPVGTLIQAVGGTIVYEVIADSTQTAYNSSLNAYVLPAGLTSVNATVQALISGTSSNIPAATLTQIQNTLYGISIVTNPLAITNGAPAWSDPQFRAAFIVYINNLSKATIGAINGALASIGPTVKYQVLDNIQIVGNPPTGINTPYYGNIAAIIGGNPTSALLAAATTALLNVMAWGMQYQVLPSAIVVPIFAMNIRLTPGYLFASVLAAIQSAIVTYVNGLAIGELIYLSEINLLVMQVPGVTAIEPNSLTINDAQADYQPAVYQESIITTAAVSAGTY